MTESNCKCWYKSKTIWFNGLCAVLVTLEASTGGLREVMPVNFYLAVSIILPAVNAFLRVMSTTNIRRPKSKE